MTVRFLLLLYVSLIIISITKPTLGFLNGNQLHPSFKQVSQRNKLRKLFVLNEKDVKDGIAFISRRVQKAVVAVVSLQLIFTAGQANAIPAVPDVTEQTANEIVTNPPRSFFSIPRSSGLLTTTTRPEVNLDGTLTDFNFRKLQWWKDTVNVGAVFKDQKNFFPGDISQIGKELESLPAAWMIFSGLTGAVLIADASQHSKKLDELTDEQATTIAEHASTIDSIGVVNANTVATLKAESSKLMEEVDSLIKQLDEKSAHIDSLSETLEGLSQSIGTSDVNSKQVLAQLAKQLVSSESLIESLKAQLREAPKNVGNGVEEDYQKQLLVFEKTIADLNQKMITVQEDATARLAIVSKNADDLLDQKKGCELIIAESKIFVEQIANATLLAATENAATIDKLEKVIVDMNLRMKEVLTRAQTLTEENTNLASKLLAAKESAVIQVAEQKQIMNEQLDKAAEAFAMIPTAGDAQKLLNQVTAENDDLKQRLLSSDESLFDLQQESETKLDSAKAMTKELKARLNERSVQQETKDGKSMFTTMSNVFYYSYFYITTSRIPLNILKQSDPFPEL